MNFVCIQTCAQIELLVHHDGVETYFCEPQYRRASQILIPSLQATLQRAKLTLGQLDYIVVTTGPGSFTGIRIGISTAKALAHVLRLPIVAVNSLTANAYNDIHERPTLSVIDGASGTCYVAMYRQLTEYARPRCITVNELPAWVEAAGDCEIVTDNPALVTPTLDLAPERLSGIARAMIERGLVTDYHSVEPVYIRRAQPDRAPGEL